MFSLETNETKTRINKLQDQYSLLSMK